MAICKLRYEMNPDKKSYTVTGIKGARQECVHIPRSYKGLPVTAIGKRAFNETLLSAAFVSKQAKRQLSEMEKIKKMSAARQERGAKGQVYMSEIRYGGIQSVRIPSSVTEIGEDAFSSCGALSCVTVEDSLQCPHQLRSIGDRAFSYCEALSELRLPATVEKVGTNAFLEVPLGSVSIDEGSPYYAMRDEEGGARSIVEKKTGAVLISSSKQISKMAFERRFHPKAVDPRQPEVGDLFGGLRYKKTADGESYVVLGLSLRPPKRVRIPKMYRSLPVIAIGWKAFESSKIEEITIPNSIERIGAVAFKNCKSLRRFTIEQSDVTENRLKKIDMGAFAECSALTEFVIPDSLTEDVDGYRFKGCSALRTVTVMEGNPVYRSEGNCVIEKATERLVFRAADAEIPKSGSVKRIAAYAFSATEKFSPEEIIPDGVEVIEDGAFERRYGLKRIRIPDSVHTIGKMAFYSTRLETVSIPEGVTVLSESVLEEGWDLQSVSLPRSITRIEKKALARCSKLTEVTYAGTVSEFGRVIREDDWRLDSAFSVVHCADGDVKVST